MPNFPSAAPASPVQYDGDATTGFIPKVSATITPAEVPISSLVLDDAIVTTSSQEIVQSNANRVSLRIRNMSATLTLWINFDENAAVNASYPIPANTEYVYNASEMGRYTASIYAVAPSATISVIILEETAA